MSDVRSDPLDGVSARESRMSVCCLPIELRPQAVKCKICGSEVEQPNHSGRLAQICRSCLAHAPEKRAA
jgi:Zn finger protein HypA/HybF involved in hydrogenase expression